MQFQVGSNSRTRASPRNPEDTQKRNSGWLIFSRPLLSQAAALPWMCVWPLPMQQRLETQRRQSAKSLRLDCQTIHQQSHGRPRGWSAARLSRLSKELDFSIDSAELGLWNSSHQYGMCRGRACCLGSWHLQSSACRHERTKPQQNWYRMSNWHQQVLQAQQVNDKHIRMQSSPSREPDRGGDCVGHTISSQLRGQSSIYQKNGDSSSTRISWSCRQRMAQPRTGSTMTSGSAHWRTRKKSPQTYQKKVSRMTSKRSTRERYGTFERETSFGSMSHDDSLRSAKE